MKNFEKYEELIKELGTGFAVDVETNKPCDCIGHACYKCLFHKKGGCEKPRAEWLYQEYKTFEDVDWSTVAIDTVIAVRDKNTDPWVIRHFAGLDEDGKVVTYLKDCDSKSGIPWTKTTWEYASILTVNTTGEEL